VTSEASYSKETLQLETLEQSNISSISFDRSGGSMLLAKKNGSVSIYDVAAS